MDNSLTGNLFEDKKKDQINIINTNSNNVNEMQDNLNDLSNMSVINITEERNKIAHERKVYGEKVMMGMINDPDYFVIPKDDYKLKNTIESYLPELISDNYRSVDKKDSEVDKITDNVKAPYRFGIKSMVAKGKEAWHSYKLKKEFTQQYKDKKTSIKNKLDMKNFEEGESESELKSELTLNEYTLESDPKFDETTYKFRKGFRTYTEEKEREEQEKDDKKHYNATYLTMQKAMDFHFKAALCNESYMTTHYVELRKNIDQCILLPELMKRDVKYWEELSPEMKKLIEYQAKTAQTFKTLFIEFGKKHHVDVMTGEFYVGAYDNDDYLGARNNYQKILREYYKTMFEIKEKNSLPSSGKFEKLYKELALKSMHEE